MASRKKSKTSEASDIDISVQFPPAGTPEERENQLIALAYDAVEARIRNGTASAAEYVHFLKAGSIKQREEMEKLQKENELLRAKTEAIDSEKTREDLYRKAIAAMRSYTIPTEEEYEDPYLY